MPAERQRDVGDNASPFFMTSTCFIHNELTDSVVCKRFSKRLAELGSSSASRSTKHRVISLGIATVINCNS